MRRLQSDNYKKLVPLKRIAEASSYSLGYVSILVQRKKLKAKKIGNKYYSTQEWFNQYLELHARDEKRITSEMTKDLPLDISESQLDKKLDESNKAKNYIDSLVEQAVEEKINLFEKKIFSERKSGVKNSYITPSGQLKTEEKNLAEILNSAIDVPEARLIADFIEPEIRLGVKWQKNLHQETKDFLAQQKQAVKKNNVFNRKEKAINLLEKTNKIFLPVALLATENLKGLKKLFDLVKNKFLILGAYFIKAISNSIKAVDNFFSEVKTLIKEKIKPNLFFKTRYLKTAVATLIIILALVSLASLKQTAIFNQNTKRIFNNIAAQIDKPLDNFKKLFINNSHVIPGESLVKNSKNSLDSLFLNLADQTRSASLSLENNISYRNKVLARRLGSIKNQVLFIVGFWQDKYENNISQPIGLIGNQFFSLKTTLNILPDKISNFSKGSLAVLHSFINYQGESIGDIAYLIQEKFNIFYLPAQTNKISQTKGRVAGVSETAPAFSSPIPRLLALADITSRRGQQVISNTKYNTVAVLEGVADKQKALSLDLGKKLARLTLSAAKGVGFVSQSSQDKLAQAEDTINQTNSSIQEYNNNGKKYLTFEANRSLWSIYNLYSRFIDKILPDQIKEKYAKYYFVPQEDQNNKSDNKISAQQQIVVEKPIKQTAIIQSSPQLSNSIKNLSISDNTAIGGALNVSGPVSFKDNLTVVGQSEFLNDVLVHTSLTVKDLIITGSIKFAGSTITGWPLATSTQITYNNTIINSTVSAGHTEVPSLGSTGPVGSQSLSAGEGGLTVGGDTHLNGENVLIAGAVDLNNLLDIDHNGLALSIGDGTTDTFTVNTSDDIVTIAATLNHTGVSQFTGDMDLNGALDLDVASTSALTVGDGTNNNISIDTINDILNFGNSSTTDQINFNAKQLAINSASSTTALLINYDGTGNIFHILDNGVSRFTMADYGITSLIASSSSGTALSVRQDDSGDILNIFDGDTEVFTILDGGNVGIGTTSPYAKLSVVGPVVAEYFHATSTTATSTFAGGLLAGNNSAFILDATSPANSLYIASNGNIGVGTSSPWGLLSVNANGLTAGAPQFVVGSSTNTNLIVANNGYVGIGTTTPKSVLSLGGSGALANGITFGPDGNGGIYSDSSGWIHLTNESGTSNATIFGTYLRADNNLIVSNYLRGGGGNTPVQIDTGLNVLSGNVGIGTTSPYAKLSVVGPVVAEYFHATSTTATSTFAGGMVVGNNNALTVNMSAPANSLYIASNGNVGVGTTTPSSKLLVKGEGLTGVDPCSGGTETRDGDYLIRTFTTSGTLTCSSGLDVEYLVVAGGGGGGGSASGGGGGAGGFRTGTLTITAGAKTVTVGAGGTGSVNQGTNGSDSVFDSITSVGGGGGGKGNDLVGGGVPLTGGSGGGAGDTGMAGTQTGAAGTSGQGNAGGNSATDGATYRAGGGGGGAGEAGDSGTSINQTPGAGGDGSASSISGTSVYYAGGGGAGSSGGTQAAGGNGGGGKGGMSGTVGEDGTPNTGGGGGGGGWAGVSLPAGDGGSGIVIVKYYAGQRSIAAIFDGGNVGIGTSSPTSLLSIQGIVGSDILNIASSTGASLMYINSSGNIGIGTTTPRTIFHIAGTDGLIIPVGTTAQRSSSPVTGTIRYNSETSQFEGYGSSSWGSLGGVIDVDQDTKITAEDSAGADNDQLKFFTANSERMRIDSNGYIGMGTTTPYSILSISNYASTPVNTPLFTIASTTAGTSTSTLMTVLANGNVGIGTTSPQYKLDIYGTAYATKIRLPQAEEPVTPTLSFGDGDSGFYESADDTIRLALAGASRWYFGSGGFGNTSGTGGWLQNSGASATVPTVIPYSNEATTGIGRAGENILSFISNGTNVMNITAGNVGIGTTSPLAKLSIQATAGSDILNIASSTGASLMYINSSGNVGIGTTSPLTKLSVQGTAGSDIFNIASSTGASLMYINSAGNVGLGTMSPSAVLHLKAGTTATGTAPLKFTSGNLMTYIEAGAIEFSGDDYYASITTGAGILYLSQYPPAQSNTYVKSTTRWSDSYYPHNATNPANSLIDGNNNGWAASNGVTTNQRFHIDLGEEKIITRIYYENYHNSGGRTDSGVQNFTFWGSNNAGAFSDLTYGTDTNWTQLSTSQSTFDQHVSANQADPKYVIVTNNTGYRYYAFKFADTYGAGSGDNYMGLRRVELQTGGTARKGIVLNDGINLVSGRIPFVTTNGRLTDTTNFVFNGTNFGVGTSTPYQTLSVAGNMALTGAFYDSLSSAGTNGMILKTTGSATEWVATSTLFTAGVSTLPTGTTGQTLTYQNSTWTATSSLYVASNGNVGIGRVPTNDKLEVAGNIWLPNDNSYLRFGSSLTGAPGISGGAVGDLNIYSWTGSGSNGIALQTGTPRVTQMYIDSSGNVGIGTTDPIYKLEVNGTSRIGGASRFDGTSRFEGAMTVYNYVKPYSVRVDDGASRYIGFGTGGDAKIYYDGSDLYIDTQVVGTGNLVIPSGNVGIGTTSPAAKLDVEGGNLLVLNPTSPASVIVARGEDSSKALSFTADSSIPLMMFDGSASSFRIASQTKANILTGTTAGRTDLVTILNSGNVGIGTTNPSSKLEIVGVGSQGALRLNGGDISTGANNYTQIVLDYNGATKYPHFIRSRHNAGAGSGNAIDFYTSDGTGNGVFPTNAVLGMTINNGNVGIGTTSPSQKLDVQGNIAIGDNMLGGGSTYGYPSGASYATLRLYDNATGYTNLNNQNYGINLQTAGANRLTVVNSGNVGIGTNSPGRLLEVAGISRLSSVSSPVGLEINADTSNTIGGGDAFVKFNTNGGNNWIMGLDDSLSGDDFAIATGNDLSSNTKLVIDSSTGNVGIGTTAPGYKLVVGAGSVSGLDSSNQLVLATDTQTRMSIVASSSDYSIIDFADTAVAGSIRYNHANDSMNLYTAASNRFTINSSGNVGIGTTDPDSLFQIYGSSASGNFFKLSHTGDAGQDLTIGYSSTPNSWITNIETGRNYDFQINGNSNFFIQNDGNVGIGTTSPGAKFHIIDSDLVLTDSISSYSKLIVENSSHTYLSIFSGSSNIGSLQFGDSEDVDAGTISYDHSSNLLSFRTNGTNTTKMVLDSSGNVGIGTTSPYAKLSIESTVGGTTPLFAIASSTAGAATSTYLFVASNGNVGIGAASPGWAKLVVQGTGGLLGGNNYPIAGFVKDSTSYKGIYLGYDNTSQTGIISGGGVNGNVAFWSFKSGPGVWSENMRIDSSGNVGIGTTTPTVGLELGSVAAGKNMIINATVGAEMAPALEAANWKATGGWSAGSGQLVKAAGSGYETITPLGTFTVVAGKSYDIVVNVSAITGSVQVSIGGTSKSLVSGINTFTLIAGNTTKITFHTYSVSATATITSVSVKEKTEGTGDLAVSGKIYTKGQILAANSLKRPAYSFLESPGSGLFYDDNIAIGFAYAGTYSVGFNSSVFAIYGSSGLRFGSDTFITRDDAYALGMRSTTNQQTFRVYNTYTDTSNYERMSLTGVAGSSVNLTAETAGTGADNLNIVLTPSGTGYTILNGNVGIGTTSPYAKLSIENTSGGLTPLFTIASSTAGAATSTYLTVASNGNVGIGTTNPGNYKLNVIGDVRSTANIFSTSFFTGNSGGVYSYYYTPRVDGDAIIFKEYGGTELMRITDPGNVGIGTTSPYAKLSVAGQTVAEYFTATSTTATSTFAGGLVAGNGSFNVLQNGNIGIGTSNPSYALDVNGSIRIPAAQTIYFSTSQSGSQIVDDGAGNVYLSGNSDLVFRTGGVVQQTMVLKNTGLVGVGTSSPLTKFSVQATAGTDILNIASSTGASLMYINSAGNIGIGTTSPYQALSVSGNMALTGALYDSLSSAGTNGMILQTTGSATKWVATSSLGIVGMSVGNLVTSGTSGSVLFVDASGNLGQNNSSFYWDNVNYKLGIGTTTPSAKLDIAGILGSQSDLFNISSTTATNVVSSLFKVQANGNVGIATSSPNYALDVNGSAAFGSGEESMRIDSNGNVGIGTTSPYARLSLVNNSAGLYDVFAISTSTSGLVFKVDSYGQTYGDGAYASPAADYAEYFYTDSVNLLPGEAVCVDVVKENAVKRCEREADNNVMGIVSTKPAVIGNYTKEAASNSNHYVIVGMLGQVDAYVSAENGPINIGDSLTSASSTPGYAMRADGGDSTVGIALESLKEGTGKIKVLISRRNKSLAVEEVEDLVVERIANMKIEDRVQQLITEAVENLNLDPKIEEIAKAEASKLDSIISVTLDQANGKIINLTYQLADLETIFNNQLAAINAQLANLTNINQNIQIDQQGNLIINISNSIEASSTPVVQIIDITSITASSTKTAFIVNQTGTGDVADFQADGVSIMNIDQKGEVKIMGSMLVDGRIMLCSGGYCSDALDSAVDETMADLGVEGKVVAGAFEGYCEDGFVWVPGSAKYGTLPGFCVMSDLMKDEFEQIKTNISQGQAQISCQALGTGYHLIGENEWLTIAENILQAADNDSDSNIAGMQLAIASPSYKLTNDNVLYNLVGSINEWTNQNVTAAGSPVTPSYNNWFEYSEVSDYKGLNIAPDYYLTDADNNIGKIYVGSTSVLKGFIRGSGGIYSLDLSHAPSEKSADIGFRCAK